MYICITQFALRVILTSMFVLFAGFMDFSYNSSRVKISSFV